MKLEPDSDINFMVSTVWYSRFQIALSEKNFSLAEKYFKRYLWYKRKSILNKYLTKLCEEKQFNPK